MGNAPSQQPGEESSRTDTTMRTDYYELLEVERSDSTTTDDIKKVSNFPSNRANAFVLRHTDD